MVLDEVWRHLDGVEALSGPHGGPLSRTVKLILDPLIIRPVQNPQCAGAILTADGAILLATRVNAYTDVLRATAAWFVLLKQVRRTLRITEGNPQDLYFQRCFELAMTSGTPDVESASAIAESAIRDIHDYAAGRTTQALKDYLTDIGRAKELTELIDLAWRRRPVANPTLGTDGTLIASLLEASVAARHGPAAEARAVLHRLISLHAGTHFGIRLWSNASGQACELGLSRYPIPRSPALGASASKATLGLPFDRTIYERVFTVLQASGERAELPAIPELVGSEIARSCSPWALLDESLRVAATAGAILAVGLRPMSRSRAHDASESVAQRAINNRWQREAYVLQARRLAVSDAELPPDNALAAIAAELRTPWRPYLRRLWVRLHGRDVREVPVSEPDELWDLLDGVARSVILDHRTRVKQALSANSYVLAASEAEAS